MVTTVEELQEALATLTLEEGDSLALEAKAFSEFSSSSLGPTISALANLPGGGTVLLGVSENAAAPLIGVDDPHSLAQKATNLARNGLSSPVTVDTRVLALAGREVVAVNVSEATANDKPVEFQGKAYIRQYDGDYTMSLQERQQLLRRHVRPRDDSIPVPGTTADDLAPEQVDLFIASVRRSTPALAETTASDILRRLNVVTATGELSVAGLYALGTYPQQHLPHLSLTAAVVPDPPDGTARAVNRKDFTGPLPRILADTVEWVGQNVSSTLVVTRDGYAGTTFEVPLVAVREVVANALVHRDLSEATSGRAVELRLTSRGLVLTSPGGLWGLSVDQLGTPDGKSAVNEFLYGICRHAGGEGRRVIEAMGTGITTTRYALESAGLESPTFSDNGLRFTVRFPNQALHKQEDLVWLATLPLEQLSPSQKEALLRMHSGAQLSNSDYRALSGVDSTTARTELQDLVRRGLAVRTGERRGTRYAVAPTPSAES